MNSRHRNDDEASFEGLIAFDTVPPPDGAGPDDVHGACTAVAQLPDSFLEALKSGVKADVSRLALARKSLAASPLIPREEPDDEEVTTNDLAATRKAQAFELPEPPTSPYGAKLLAPDTSGDLARAIAAVRSSPPERSAPPPAPPLVEEPYAPSPSYRPSPTPEPASLEWPPSPGAPERLPRIDLSTPPPVSIAPRPAAAPSLVARLDTFRRSVEVRFVLIVMAVVITFAIVLTLWARLLQSFLSD